MNENHKICLLGATFRTNNLGVSALTDGIIKSIQHQFPDAQIFLLDYGKERRQYDFKFSNGTVKVQLLNLRFSKKIYLKNNIAVLILLTLLLKIIPFTKIKNRIIAGNFFLSSISEMDFCASIAGGDSFSDIYGLARFFYVALPQLLVLFIRRELILLPQTLGPFRTKSASFIAGYILKRSELIYSRDYTGLKEMNSFLGESWVKNKLNFCYDVAFIVDPVKPEMLQPEDFFVRETYDSPVVGLNISGLLFIGGYNRNNMFGLKIDYKHFIYDLIDRLIIRKKSVVFLIPHVFGSMDHPESDYVVCKKIFSDLKTKYKSRIFTVDGTYNQNEIKYIIGLCDFFIGSRMHACIAALSQCIPSVPVAYSKKFYGVMQTIGTESFVADPRHLNEEEIWDIVERAFEQRDFIRSQLNEKIPSVQTKVFNLFSEISTKVNKESEI